MSNLNYVPSWLDSAMTLLEKLNKCIEKIETIVNTVVSVTKTANDALSLANTNKSDITAIQGDVTAIQGDVTAIQGDVNRLDNNITSTRELTDQALSTANRAETKADEATAKANTNATNITALQNEKSPKLYLHDISITISNFTVKFKKINNESEPINNYVGAQYYITNGGFDFSASGAVGGGITCNTQVGDAHFVITYGKMEGSAFSELTYNNTFYFIDRDGALNNVTSIYKDGAPSAFTDNVTEL